MKLVYSTGKVLQVYDLASPLVTLRAIEVPIRYNGYHILDDDKAREVLRELLRTGLYHKD